MVGVPGFQPVVGAVMVNAAFVINVTLPGPAGIQRAYRVMFSPGIVLKSQASANVP